MHTHILIIDADQAQANLLAFLLKTGGYDVVILRDPCRTSNILGERQIDLILLDARVPLVDGLLLCTHLKRQHEDVPLILLGTDATSAEIAVGLAHGADDYVRLPFDPAELLARIAALLRCYRASMRVNGTTIVTVEHRHLDVAQLTFTGTAGQVVDLTPTEMRLLRCLMEHTGTVIARAYLRNAVWRDDPGRITHG